MGGGTDAVAVMYLFRRVGRVGTVVSGEGSRLGELTRGRGWEKQREKEPEGELAGRWGCKCEGVICCRRRG